ncbi:putative NADPH-quinone reductase [Cricetibacter osteomyelitidis]|uniref:Putative NADPH-quinone reductase n=1 Tax=Cricetibacter osteomyelitidis TaxID=1521931 RepID=A0A4R2TJG6_9PAST|nr:NAD(P)H-dependent oxidoreductase [Cricetibacter osteomyelitidis]TCP94952.1 putative NADPH-quinone reductase [Cricetibacter osteomyelitidis]
MALNHLIIFVHPNGKESFNRAVAERVVATSEKLGVETHVRDLYSLEFNPLLSVEEMQGTFQGIISAEIQREQHFIRQADLITLVYPLWWMGFPAMLKGYLDRVLSYGFAYKTDNGSSVGLLTDKKLQQFVTIGSNVATYQELGWDKALDVTLANGLFGFCGIRQVEQMLLGDIHKIDDMARQLMLDEVEQKTSAILTALQQQEEN